MPIMAFKHYQFLMSVNGEKRTIVLYRSLPFGGKADDSLIPFPTIRWYKSVK